MPEILTGKVIEIAQLDTRSKQAKYFKNFQDAEGKMDDAAFKKAVTAAKGKYNKPVLVIESLSSHYGYINGNQAYYQTKHGPKSAQTFTKPYLKPVLKGHNMFSDADPIGRVTDAKYMDFPDIPKSKQNDLVTRKGVIRTFSTITDPDGIEKIMDMRFLTQSVSGITPTVDCSICGTNLREKGCEHNIGQTYDEKLCYKIFGPIRYDEVSFVWKPADAEAKTLRFQTVGPQDAMDMLLQDAIEAEMVESADYEELSYYIQDSCGSRKKMYSFADNKEVASENMVTDISTTVPAAEQPPSSSQIEAPKNQEDRRSPMDKKLSECTIKDILEVAMVKDHLASLVQDVDAKRVTAEASVQTLTAKVADLEKVMAAQKTEIEGLTTQVKAIDAQRLTSKVAHLVDTLVTLKKPAVKAIIDEKDAKKQTELRDALTAEYAKKSEVVIDELIASYDAELPKADAQGAITQQVTDTAAARDSRLNANAKGPSLTRILDRK